MGDNFTFSLQKQHRATEVIQKVDDYVSTGKNFGHPGTDPDLF